MISYNCDSIGLQKSWWLHCVVQACLTYYWGKKSLQVEGIIVNFHTAIMSMQILKFCSIMWLLYQRFSHLQKLILPNESANVGMKIMIETSYFIDLQKIRWLHWTLSMAANEINNVYSIQLCFWVTSLTLNGIRRMNSFLDGIEEPDDSAILLIRDSLIVISSFAYLFLIAISCHFTCLKANCVGEDIFSVYSLVQSRFQMQTDDFKVPIYFCVKKLHFTAASGLFEIHLPLLMSIVKTMTAYLVILRS
ncbi:uncharacterized protein LOC122849370 [Aphidius gifuensis]|uniref:uncharacterized protein LOC122849370 n=1 Tax=Aphidius gifuensis TaxID=684658 RepID=UPI001CDBACB3|nr:uncharacterized protein LOC122849370 [Aphidius gifuensis]